MIKKIFKYFLRFKHGLLILVLFLMISSFILGFWWNSGNENSSLINRVPPLSAEEKLWKEQGLLIDDGIYFVGSEIKPGIYRTKGTDVSLYGCNWQRLSGFEAENNNVIVNYYEDKGLPTIVAIAPTDKGFKTNGCGKWYAESIMITMNSTNFGDGAFIVGVDVQPGIYRSSAQAGCYWERLNGFTRDFYSGRLFGRDTELITYSNNLITEIKPTDKGFISHGCRQWVKQTPSDS